MNKNGTFINTLTRKVFEENNSDFGERLCRGAILVEWVDLGEGWSGDYDPDDPSDESLLRFDVMRWDNEEGWIAIDDASYCTQVPVDTDPTILDKLLHYLMDEIFDPANNDYSIKKLCERLSWIEPSWAR